MLAAILLIPVFAASASADNAPVTFTGTEVIPVPPASNFPGVNGGGDGWAVALSSDSVYNVFHHQGFLGVACHRQVDAQPCWGYVDPQTKQTPVTVTLTQPNGDGSFSFATSGQPGLFLDQKTGRLYVYATRSDGTAGVVCFDPSKFDPAVQGSAAASFCGFTGLTGVRQAVGGGVSDPVLIGSKWYAFDYLSGGTTGAENEVLCFDTTSDTACDNQPFAAQLSSDRSAVSAGTFPAPATAGIAGRMFIPITVNGTSELDCFDPSTADRTCSGWSPVHIDYPYASGAGAPFPMLDKTGVVIGVCLPIPGVPCYTLAGAHVDTPQNLAATINAPTQSWNGPAFVLGPRVYVPNGYGNNAAGAFHTDEVDCFDFNLGTSCPGTNADGSPTFPKQFGESLSYLYTVNTDPQRPTCIWVNSDRGDQQIQNFDAFTGGPCGEGPIRVRADSFVVNAPKCTPGSYTSLQVTQPAPGTYKSGTVSFQDPSGNAIPGASDVALDANGIADLSNLNLNTAAGLPQFLITIDTGGAANPQQVVVKLTWQGAFDPSCATDISTIVNPPANTPPVGPPPESDVSVSVAGPTYVREGSNVTFVDTIKNTGKNTATGVELNSPIPAGTNFVSATLSNGNSCITITSANKITCFVGTLGSGSSATATIVVAPTGTGSVTQTATVQGDYDTNPANNTASSTTAVIAQGAAPPPPPKPDQPGTFNAIATGTVLVNGQTVAADQVIVLHSGDTVDVTNGTITITDFDGGFGTFGNVEPTPRRHVSTANGSTATGTIPAVFQIQQDAQAGAGVTLTLTSGDFSVCSTPRALAAKNQTAVRQLWGNAHGNFTTKARYSSATIRGTIWLTQDRCDGSLTQAVNDVVTVVDFVKNQTITLQPGQSYLAQPKQAAFKPPATKKKPAKKTHGTQGQTAATIRKNGLLWANELFSTQAQFTAWLKSKGLTWQQFAAKNPKFAEALAGRK